MNNGQMNIDSMPAVMPMVAQEPSVQVTSAPDGVRQAGGNFAGVLSGIQHVSKGKDVPDSGQTERVSIKAGKRQVLLNAGTEEPTVDLLAQLHASPVITPASESAAPKQEEHEKEDITALGKELSDAASQMAVVAYLQTGRMPEVNIPAQPSVDRLQTVPVQPDVISTPQVPEVISPVQPGIAAESAASLLQAAASGRIPEVSIPAQLHVAMLQKGATASAHPAVISAPDVTDKPEQTHAKPVEASQAIMTARLGATPEPAPQAAAGRMPEVNIPAPLSVDRPQKVATVPAQPDVISVSAEKNQVVQTTAEPVQAIPVEQPAASFKTLQSEPPPAHQDVPASVSSPESEVEISLSQPRPITARVTTAPAVAGNHSALVQEARGAAQRLTSEQPIEKVRTGNEQGAVKEMATSVQVESSSGESLGGSGTQHGNTSNQGQSEGSLSNRMSAQEMSGQLGMEHQKVAAVTTKAVLTEPVRQDIPEQVMQQVKERLVQHDVKPGNQQITLTLSPDNLGELKMNLNLQGQKLSVEIITENRTVRDAIMQHTDALKESLARQNIKMESFDVTTGGKGSGNQGQNQNAWRELAKQQNQQQLWTSPRGYHTAQADLPTGPVYQRQLGQTMLDIHY